MIRNDTRFMKITAEERTAHMNNFSLANEEEGDNFLSLFQQASKYASLQGRIKEGTAWAVARAPDFIVKPY